jgi:hypothetical protein
MERTREERLRNIEELVQFLREHPECPLPSDWEGSTIGGPTIPAYLYAKDRVPGALRALADGGLVTKESAGGYLRLSRSFGGLTYVVKIPAESVCRKKVVGYKTIPPKILPEMTIEVTEWECPDSLLEGVAGND